MNQYIIYFILIIFINFIIVQTVPIKFYSYKIIM